MLVVLVGIVSTLGLGVPKSLMPHDATGLGIGACNVELLEDAKLADDLAKEVMSDYLTGAAWL